MTTTDVTSWQHAMLAVRGPEAGIQATLNEIADVEVACINGPKDLVVPTTIAELDHLAEELKETISNAPP